MSGFTVEDIESLPEIIESNKASGNEELKKNQHLSVLKAKASLIPDHLHHEIWEQKDGCRDGGCIGQLDSRVFSTDWVTNVTSLLRRGRKEKIRNNGLLAWHQQLDKCLNHLLRK